MPGGKPKFEDIRYYPSIVSIKEAVGTDKMLMALWLLVQDFCRSINVVRNMNEDQMIEAASMLLDEAGNFRLEDYVMMFTMAKRNQIGNIFDHLDLQVIGKIVDDYWAIRDQAGKALQEQEFNRYESVVNSPVYAGNVPDGMVDSLIASITDLEREVAQEKSEVRKRDSEARMQQIRDFASKHGISFDDYGNPIPPNR